MIAVVDARVAGQLAVVEQQHRREGLDRIGLLAARLAGDGPEVGCHLVVGVVVEGFLRNDADGLRIGDLDVEIDFWRHCDGLLGRSHRHLVIFQVESVEKTYSQRVVHPDFPGDVGHAIRGAASASAAAGAEAEECEHHDHGKGDLFHIVQVNFCLLLLYNANIGIIVWIGFGIIKRICSCWPGC